MLWSNFGEHTQRGKIHEAWEGDCPVVHNIDDTATIELLDDETLGQLGLTRNSLEGHRQAMCLSGN